MKAKIYTLICLVLSLTMCIMLSACSTHDNQSKNEDKYSDYKLISENNEFFIVFDDLNMYQEENQDTATIDFSTMKEFKDSVTKGLLNDTQKRIMATAFQKNSAGAIKVCDFNNLYIPKLPTNGVVNGVSWQGQSYSFGLSLSDGVFGLLAYLTESQFNRSYQEDYVGLFNRDTINVTKTETLDDGKVATYYTTRTGELMNVRYTLTVGTTIIEVDKTFRLKMQSSELPTSSTVPSNVELYITSGDTFCYVSLYDFSEDPTDEWLSNFGLERFVDGGAV